MERIISCKACAKINLHLAVGLPDETGYHGIESVFAKVGLCDTLVVEWSEAPGFSVRVRGLERYCEPGTDTLSRAAALWYGQSRVPLSLSVECSKEIPVKSGLGGGSSDAAALLLALQKIAGGNALDRKRLMDVGMAVGSDVPFFLSGYSQALVTGKGERIEGLRASRHEVLLVMPTDFSVSTAEAYGRLDGMSRREACGGSRPRSFYESVFLQDSRNWGRSLRNDFSRCTGNDGFYRTLGALAESFDGYGNLSGSGACWFFVGERREEILGLREKIGSVFGSGVRMWLAPLVC